MNDRKETECKIMSEILTNKKPPYICTPLTGKTREVVLEQLDTVITQEPDIIEWRADFLTGLANTTLVLEIISEMKAKTAIPLLFTIRAEHEGGETITLSEEDKVQLMVDVCEKSAVDLVDYETSNDKKFVQQITDAAKSNEKKIILSYHNFNMTPDEAELIERAQQAAAYGADIAKFAVMPNGKDDVFRLLEVTKMIDSLLDIPVVTMSMGDIGGLSRILGWAYGSIITFGVGVELSAPGQIPVKKLRETIELTQELVPSWE
jgi:3-dehydroquinate dehydratase-1